MSYTFEQVKEAYVKLKSYVYFDNTDILLRKKLVEFETNLTKEGVFALFPTPQPYKKKPKDLSLVDHKLLIFTDELNNYHENRKYFDSFLQKISVNFYPKEIKEEEVGENFITNKRVKDKYDVNRLTAFIDAPIELHLISVLWILEHGKSYDRELGDNCFGNRLLLNKNKDGVVKGSGLFKPYYSQYQKWRDDSVNAAKEILGSNKSALFFNFDVKDYFHCVRINVNELYKSDRYRRSIPHYYNLQEIFLNIHTTYTRLIASNYKIPYDFSGEVVDKKGNITNVILPIGLLSSYVLANSYLKEFDTRVVQRIKPAYYGRYVDDILLVIADPQLEYHEKETIKELKFDFDVYHGKMSSHEVESGDSVSFSKDEISILEKYVLYNFYPLLKLVDTPTHIGNHAEGIESRSFKLTGYSSLYCQSAKSLVYYFDNEESDLVIDKLKKELDLRTSEFRDFPEDEKNEESFEDSAYYLQYDGSSGKIRTLKDYKEDRYGLTVYLANKIFSALRHEKIIPETEKDQVLKFFRGSNALRFHRLWERIFTFFLVNKQADAYVRFYLHCVEQIQRLELPEQSHVFDAKVRDTLLEYLDCAHELALSLNPKFITKTKAAARHFEFQLNRISGDISMYLSQFEPTKSDAFWGKRFRITNMMRHHYVIHPLLNFTEASKKNQLDLTSLKIDFSKFSLDEGLLQSSPRPIKLWECCQAVVMKTIAKFDVSKEQVVDSAVLTELLNVGANGEFYLEEAIDLYKEINAPHIPDYVLNDEDFISNIYDRNHTQITFDNVKPVTIQEIVIKSPSNRLKTPRIAFANTEVLESNIRASIRNEPNLSFDRYQKLADILRKAREAKSDLLLFPESFIPINLLSSLVRYATTNESLTITGLEHITIEDCSFNFLVTILPVSIGGVRDSIVVFRLKNHYAHSELELIDGNHFDIPKPKVYRYDVFVWKNLYLAPYYCFELANSFHRSLLKGKIDLMIGVEWNKDTPYFSNIVEASSRDLHCYVAQVNTSQYGDSRLTQPVETARKDILRLKGGTNDAILVGQIDIPKLREFQREKFSLTHKKAEFKPLPPDFPVKDALKRIKNERIL